MNIVLIGYMGSGKSTIGRVLAKSINYNFLDLDSFIEEKEEMSISNIFKSNGEIYFRKKEAYYLSTLLETNNKTVIALGGGTPCFGNNMNTILTSKNSESIYLKAKIPTLVKRLFTHKASRPLITHVNSIPELNEFIGKHLFEREPYYRKAEHIINTDNKEEKDIIEEIIFELF